MTVAVNDDIARRNAGFIEWASADKDRQATWEITHEDAAHLAARLAAAEAALECYHDEDRMRFAEIEGQTWSVCPELVTAPDRKALAETVLRVLAQEATTPEPESWGGERADARDALAALAEPCQCESLIEKANDRRYSDEWVGAAFRFLHRSGK